MSLTFIDFVFVKHLSIQHCGRSIIALVKLQKIIYVSEQFKIIQIFHENNSQNSSFDLYLIRKLP